MIKAEDQYYIRQVEVFVCREGRSLVDERHLKTEKDYEYYQVDGKEIRYVICDHHGVRGRMARIYEGAIQDECYFASSVCAPTRKYIRLLDNTYFKFYDDAEEVLNNATNFIKWLKTVPTLNLKQAQIKNIMKMNEHLIKDVPDFQEMALTQALNSTLKLKMRSDLKGLELFNQNELDLVPERD